MFFQTSPQVQPFREELQQQNAAIIWFNSGGSMNKSARIMFGRPYPYESLIHSDHPVKDLGKTAKPSKTVPGPLGSSHSGKPSLPTGLVL